MKNEIDRLNATVTFNAVSKDQERLQKQYEMEIRTQQYQLESLTEELKLIEEQMNAYCINNMRSIIIAEDVLVGHLGFYRQKDACKTFFEEHYNDI